MFEISFPTVEKETFPSSPYLTNSISLPIEAFNNDIDVHSRTAALIYGLSINEIQENHRRVAKTINYSIVYGAGPYRISQELNIPMKEAVNIIENYFQRYPGIN